MQPELECPLPPKSVRHLCGQTKAALSELELCVNARTAADVEDVSYATAWVKTHVRGKVLV